MWKVRAVIYAFTVAVMIYLYLWGSHIEKKYKDQQMLFAQEREKYELRIATLEREKQNALDVATSKKELERAVQEDNSGFDWKHDIADTVPMLALKQLHNSRIQIH